MKLLLDTHALLWFLTNSPELSRLALAAIESPDNTIYVSVMSLWEIAIKLSIGKLTLPDSFERIFPAQLDLNGITCLSIRNEDLYRVCQLPLHHRDPFERILIAQASSDGLTLVSRDEKLSKYGVPMLW